MVNGQKYFWHWSHGWVSVVVRGFGAPYRPWSQVGRVHTVGRDHPEATGITTARCHSHLSYNWGTFFRWVNTGDKSRVTTTSTYSMLQQTFFCTAELDLLNLRRLTTRLNSSGTLLVAWRTFWGSKSPSFTIGNLKPIFAFNIFQDLVKDGRMGKYTVGLKGFDSFSPAEFGVFYPEKLARPWLRLRNTPWEIVKNSDIRYIALAQTAKL